MDEGEARLQDYVAKASTIAHKPILVEWGECGFTHTGAKATGSSGGDSIRLIPGLSLPIERSVFVHELGHVCLKHTLATSVTHEQNNQDIIARLPEESKARILDWLEEMEREADEFGRRILPLLWPGEIFQFNQRLTLGHTLPETFPPENESVDLTNEEQAFLDEMIFNATKHKTNTNKERNQMKTHDEIHEQAGVKLAAISKALQNAKDSLPHAEARVVSAIVAGDSTDKQVSEVTRLQTTVGICERALSLAHAEMVVSAARVDRERREAEAANTEGRRAKILEIMKDPKARLEVLTDGYKVFHLGDNRILQDPDGMAQLFQVNTPEWEQQVTQLDRNGIFITQ